MLLSGLSATGELLVALTCRFALDIFTIIQQDYPVAVEEAAPIDLELEDLGLCDSMDACAQIRGCGWLVKAQPTALVDVHKPLVARLSGEIDGVSAVLFPHAGSLR